MDYVAQLGVGGIFAILVIREVISFLQAREDKKNGTARGVPDCAGPVIAQLAKISETMRLIGEQMKATGEHCSDLHKWHNVKDRDGMPIWYYRRSMEEAIDRLHTGISKQTDVLVLLSQRQERQADVLERIAITQERLWDKMQIIAADVLANSAAATMAANAAVATARAAAETAADTAKKVGATQSGPDPRG